MRGLITDFERLTREGARVGRAVVTSVWGSAPRPEGANLLATADGRIAGSVSGGCVETATAEVIGAAIRTGAAHLVSFGVSNERAWEVGLACGGTIKVFVQPEVPPLVLEAARGPGGMVVATIVESAGPVGESAAFDDKGRIVSGTLQGLEEQVGPLAADALAREASRSVELSNDRGSVTVFLEVFPRQPVLVIFGGVHIAEALVPMARRLGYRTVVADGRQAFLTPERFPDADELILAWPEEAFRRAGLGPATYVCILSHDPKFDEPALELALRSPAPYIGAIGSRKTQASRRARLKEMGFSEADIARVHGPIGLDLGGRSSEETALAILAEMTLTRYGSRRNPAP